MWGDLPSDILYDIFSYYQYGEDDFHPLETLLLVSKYWASVACSDRALWARYKIRLGHEPTMKMWKARLPIRLKRSGDLSPIEIDISTEMDGENDPCRNAMFYPESCLGETGDGRSYWPCRCNAGHNNLLNWVLNQLTGPSGELCKRWKFFRFYSDTYYTDFGPGSGARGLFTALSFATPFLVSVSLHRVSVNAPGEFELPLLPFSPLLREISFSSCCLPLRLPNMERARRVQISATSHWSTNFVNLRQAARVERLAVNDQDIGLPLELPHVWHLTLTGWKRRMAFNFAQVSMPRLTHLALNIGDIRLWRDSTSHRTLPFQQLKQLEIRRTPHSFKLIRYQELIGSIFEVLHISTSLVSVLASAAFFSILVKWTWISRRAIEGLVAEDGNIAKPWNWQGSVSLLSLSNSPLGILSGSETSVELEILARHWGLSSPDGSWETLIQILAYS